ncbi:MAG: PQQ-dependent sugar dehydrogenase [Thermoanaerobaculia bacterium]
MIAPSGMVVYTGNACPGWGNSIFVGSMQPGALVRLELQNGRVVKEERYLGHLNQRIRDVEQGPDGLLYLLTDSPQGRILRLEQAVDAPAERRRGPAPRSVVRSAAFQAAATPASCRPRSREG